MIDFHALAEKISRVVTDFQQAFIESWDAPVVREAAFESIKPLGDVRDELRQAYDSRPDTFDHIAKVRAAVLHFAHDLIERAHVHDQSKLVDPELSVFDIYTPKLKDSTYGSDEYKEFLVGMGVGLAHHYAANDHHPEHFAGGIHEMTLVQLLELLCDWRAATMRHADGDLERSISINAERFGYGPEITGLLLNTARSVGWIMPK